MDKSKVSPRAFAAGAKKPDIEIPYEQERNWRYRLFEILPGTLSWSMLALPFILSLINVTIAAIFVLIYLLINFTRAIAAAIRSLQGYRMMRHHQELDWQALATELESGEVGKQAKRPKWHYGFVRRFRERADAAALEPAGRSSSPHIVPSDIIHAVIIATYKESREVLEPTIRQLMASEYNMEQVILVLAYEERGGPDVAKRAKQLIKEFGGNFMHAMAVQHPADIPGEIIGKGGNITYAGRRLQEYLEKQAIDPLRVVVTTLDADNRTDKKYLAALSYVYAVCPDPVHASFQPVSLYTNNIWDAPAPMRVVATGNSFFNIVLSLRQHALRNFSAHAQPMAALIETDFWSVRTIVEDGHQFWRSYFTFDGNYRVYPLYVPIYQDAVMTEKYTKTLKAQFIQLRRWTWGASDIAYCVDQAFFKSRFRRLPKFDLMTKLWRLTEGHVTWAVGPLLVLGGGFIPAWFVRGNIASNQLDYTISSNLPYIVSNVQTVALIFAIVTVYFAFLTLPPKPDRYRRHRTLWMVLQWVYLPFTTIVYNSFAALYSQTRLMLGLYLSKFDVTEKAVVTADKQTIAEQKEIK